MASKLPDIVPLTDLEQDAASVLSRARHSQTPTVITQHGRPAAVLVSIEAYRRAEGERDLLVRLAKGEREIASDEGHHLDQVLSEVDSLLRERGE